MWTTMRLLRSSSSSSKEQINGEKNRSLLYLNVYDLTPVNNYLYWAGLGVFHSGIEGTKAFLFSFNVYCYAYCCYIQF